MSPEKQRASSGWWQTKSKWEKGELERLETQGAFDTALLALSGRIFVPRNVQPEGAERSPCLIASKGQGPQYLKYKKTNQPIA